MIRVFPNFCRLTVGKKHVFEKEPGGGAACLLFPSSSALAEVQRSKCRFRIQYKTALIVLQLKKTPKKTQNLSYPWWKLESFDFNCELCLILDIKLVFPILNIRMCLLLWLSGFEPLTSLLTFLAVEQP